MVSRGFTVFLAFLRIATGVSLFLTGLHKLGWFAHPEVLQQKFTEWSAHPANPIVAKYLAYVTPHYGLLARLVAAGELGVGLLLIAGFLTPLAALLGFIMVLNFQLGSGSIFSLNYVTAQSGICYLLVFPVLMLGRAGTSLGVDGMIAGSSRSSKPAA